MCPKHVHMIDQVALSCLANADDLTRPGKGASGWSSKGPCLRRQQPFAGRSRGVVSYWFSRRPGGWSSGRRHPRWQPRSGRSRVTYKGRPPTGRRLHPHALITAARGLEWDMNHWTSPTGPRPPRAKECLQLDRASPRGPLRCARGPGHASCRCLMLNPVLQPVVLMTLVSYMRQSHCVSTLAEMFVQIVAPSIFVFSALLGRTGEVLPARTGSCSRAITRNLDMCVKRPPWHGILS